MPQRINRQKELQTMAQEAILSRDIDNVILGSVLLPKSRLISPELSDEEESETSKREKHVSKFDFDIDKSVFRDMGHRKASKYTHQDYEVDQSVIRDTGHRRATY